jgi:hypothetical protein
VGGGAGPVQWLADLLDLMERTEFFLLWLLKNIGEDFIENPDLVLPELLGTRVCRPDVPSFGAVCRVVGIAIKVSTGAGSPSRDFDIEGLLGNEKDTRVAPLGTESLLTFIFCITSSTFGPFPATGYKPVTGGAAATAAS